MTDKSSTSITFQISHSVEHVIYELGAEMLSNCFPRRTKNLSHSVLKTF